MKASESLQNDESTANETALHRAVDTTPAFIHTARPDGYLDYFNRGWLDFFGKSLEEVRSQMKAPNFLHLVEDGDHSLRLTKRGLQAAAETQDDVDQRILAAISKFVNPG